ncbi:AMP-binding protein [Sulfurimonas sp. HSL-3221]|uniref:AMP-binding protein n=1 Tax=Sulfurimonadaceae TaxID=2771471 RepID=UPI001E509580|nr:AMP-binding protein [Sulfurimonas sp. HSL-3221]UFS62522.1 AMP-binding protein [Sulfurimonas sp. HSL-3221]
MKIGKVWNEKFSREGYLYGTQPNAYLKEVMDSLPQGARILFLGEGEGRNACYAAERGFEAHAIDASEVGLQKLQEMAKSRGVNVEVSHMDLAHWEPEGRYDAVLCSYLHLEEPLRTAVFVKALAAVKEDGLFAGEFFATSQIERDSGGPKAPELLYDLKSFEKLKRPWFDCEELEACSIELDEGKGHQGLADVIRVRFRHNSDPRFKITLPELTLSALLERSVTEYAERPVLRNVDESVALSYAEFGEAVAALKTRLADAGIGIGDRVALCSENMPNWGVVYFAVTTMGAVIVPILPDFHDNEVRHIITHSQSKAVFASAKKREALDEGILSSLVMLVLTEDLSDDPTFAKRSPTILQKVKEGVKGSKHADVHYRPSEDDLAAIIYTSGTTGSSKGVMLTHRALTFEALVAQCVVELVAEDRFLSILPLAHTYECSVGFLLPIVNGASVYYLSKVPTPKILIDAMALVKPTVILSVPLVIEKIFKNRILSNFHKNALMRALYAVPFIRKALHKIAGKKLLQTFGGELRIFGIGGAPLSPMVEHFLDDAGFPYAIGYGLTETAPLLAAGAPFKTKVGAIGPAISSVELRIADPDEKGVGTVWAKGPNVMLGYYKDPEKSAEVLHEDGWFNTEDLGYIDAEGYLFLSGRSKNVILGPSGENIYPEQLEAKIMEDELVEDALVYEVEKQLVARIHLNYEMLDEHMDITKLSETEQHIEIEKLLERIKTETNESVSKFSRIARVIEQREPFVKTPTKKIKRYLYTNG